MNQGELRAKYGMDNPPNPDDPIAGAALAAERITAGAHGRDNAPLFDPAWCPAMWERAKSAKQELLDGIADNRIRLNDANNLADLEQLPDDAVVVWAVGRDWPTSDGRTPDLIALTGSHRWCNSPRRSTTTRLTPTTRAFGSTR